MSFRVMMHAAHHLFCMLASFTIPDLCSPFKASLCACFVQKLFNALPLICITLSLFTRHVLYSMLSL